MSDAHGAVLQWERADIGLEQGHLIHPRNVAAGHGENLRIDIGEHDRRRYSAPQPTREVGEPGADVQDRRPGFEQADHGGHARRDAARKPIQHRHLAEVPPQLDRVQPGVFEELAIE